MRQSLRAATLAAGFLALATTGARTADSNVARDTLDNGLRVIVVRDALAPVVTTEINYLVGSNEAPEGFPGMAHAQEHMMFRGSPGLSAAQLSTISAAMGGDFDADTTQTVTQYFFTVPSAQLGVALRIEADRMRGVLDTDALWDKERGAIEQEVARDISDPGYVFYARLLATMFAGTPYEHDALGTRASFDRTTGDMLQAFHRAWYAPNNAVLVIAGDVDPAKTIAEVRSLFGPIPSKTLPARPTVALRPFATQTIEMDTDRAYGLAAVAFRFPGSDSPDFAAAQVLADVLASQRGDLYALVPAGRALSAEFDYSPFREAGVAYAMAAFPKGADGKPLVSEIERILSAAATGGVPAELVEAAKRREIADAAFGMNSVSGLADSWSDAVAVEGRRSPDDDTDAIRRVTPDQVNRVAKRYLLDAPRIVGLLTPTRSGSAAPVSAQRGKESFATPDAKPVSLPDWARAVVAEPRVPSTSVHPTVTTLPNGLRLIVQRETISPTVTVAGRVKTAPELQVPRGQEGVASVVDGLFSYGTTTLDRVAFQKALDDIAADESAGSAFSLHVLAPHFEEGMRLLASNLLEPALPQQAFETVREETASELAGEMESPGYQVRRALKTGLYPKGDPALREATPATVRGLSLEQVKAYYRAAFRPDMTTIVVIGDVTPAEVEAVVERTFGAWKAVGPKPVTTLPAIPANPPSAAAVPDSSRVQDEVTLAQTLGITRFSPDYYPLQVANQVLTGGFYASRLYRDLREEAGLVYTVESAVDAGRTRAFFSVDYACDPPNVSKARALVERDIAALRNAEVSADELRRAKTLLVRGISLSESSVDAIAGRLVADAVEGLPLDEPVRAATRYVAVTAAEVKAAVGRWIRPDGFVQVSVGPPPK
jgi:zinc protease